MAAKVKLKKPPAIDSRICIFVGGDPGVGKSTLVKHLESSDRGEEVLPPTIMSDCRNIGERHLPAQNVTVRVDCIDTPGETKFAAILPIYLHLAEAVFLTFALDRYETFEALQRRWPELREHYAGQTRYGSSEQDRRAGLDHRVILLIGNKLDVVKDKPEKRAVSRAEVELFVKKFGVAHYYEISAKHWSLDELRMPLDIALGEVVKRRQQAIVEYHRRGGEEEDEDRKDTNPFTLDWGDKRERETHGIYNLGGGSTGSTGGSGCCTQ